MLIVRPKELDEGDRRKSAVADVQVQVRLVLHVGGGVRVAAIRLGGIEWFGFLKVREGLVMPLEQRVNGVGSDAAEVEWIALGTVQRVAPTAGVPLPGNTRIVEKVADVLHIFSAAGFNIVE